MLEYIFKAMLITSLVGTVATFIFSALRPITRKYFSTSWHYYTWLVVLIAMIMPFRFTGAKKLNNNEVYTFFLPVTEVSQYEEITTINENPVSDSEVEKFVVNNINTIAIIWISTAALFLSVKIISYAFLCIKLRKNSEEITYSELKSITDNRIVTRVSESVASPFIIGFIRPTLILPKVLLTEKQLENVLAHELTHHKRKDILYKWFVCIVKCIHWFNPVVYYISKQVNYECEISCDAKVVKNMSDDERAGYIDTIITLISYQNNKSIIAGMANDKHTLKRRFMMIKSKRKISKKAIVISIALLAVIIGGTVFASGMLNGKYADKSEEVSELTEEPHVSEKQDGEDEVIEYAKEEAAAPDIYSEPVLIPAEETEELPSPDTEIDVTVKENDEIELKEINIGDPAENPVEGEISMNFGKREHPITGEISEHNGIDIKAPEGTDVVSAINGIVTEAGYDSKKGNYIVVEKDNVKTLYAQLASINVEKGDEITAKQLIGKVGKTGNATGAHLHFEVIIDGEYVDPSEFIK